MAATKPKSTKPAQKVKLLKQRDNLHQEWQTLKSEVDSLLIKFNKGDFDRWDEIEKRKLQIARSLRKIEGKILDVK